MTQLEKRKALLLNKLMEEEDFVTSKQLAAFAGVSVRTIKSDIAVLNEAIAAFGISIESVPHKGYLFKQGEGMDVSRLGLLMKGEKATPFYRPPQDSNERVFYLIRKLVVVDYPLLPADLADEIFVGEATLTKDLQKVRLVLAQHNLKLSAEQNGEVLVMGSEIDKRLCMAEFFFHSLGASGAGADAFGEGLNRQEAEGIRKILRLVCQEYDIVLSDVSLNNLMIHVFISLVRYRLYNYIEPGDVSYQSFGGTAEYEAARKLTEALQEAYGFVIPESEIIYYAMHLQVKRIYDEISLGVPEKIKVNACISEMFIRISEEFGIDLSDDQELHHYLYQHIPLMIIRLKNHMSFRYPKVSENPSTYLYSVKVTCIAAAVIGQYYDVKLNVREFEYLVIYFCFAINKKEELRQIRIGLYNGGGRAETVMYCDALRRAFYQEKYAVQIVDYRQLLKSPDEIDVYVSTCSLELPEGRQAVIIKDNSYLDDIRKAIYQHRIRNLKWELYFEPWCVEPGLKGRTCVQIRKNAEEILKAHISGTDSLEEQFRNIEYMEIGKGIVSMNDMGLSFGRDFIFLAVLEKPLIWEREICRMILMIHCEDRKNGDLPVLCYMASNWMNRCSSREIMEQEWNYRTFKSSLKNAMEG